jgi:hypothetical protein
MTRIEGFWIYWGGEHYVWAEREAAPKHKYGSRRLHEPTDALDQVRWSESFLDQHGLHAAIQPLTVLCVEIPRSDDDDRDVLPAGLHCKAATTAKPSISGIIRSSRITSGLVSWIRLSASRPFSASRTVHCEPSSHASIRSRWTASSSTSRTRVGRAGARNRPIT